jgi:hypothetical protein
MNYLYFNEIEREREQASEKERIRKWEKGNHKYGTNDLVKTASLFLTIIMIINNNIPNESVSQSRFGVVVCLSSDGR